LKTRLGGEVMEVRPKERAQVGKALAILTQLVGATASVRHDSQTITVSPARSGLVSAAMVGLEQAEVGLSHLALRQPSLDEVFFSLTGDDYRALSAEAAA
jgi:oleandomycin transport system ATP-binding protein